MQNRKFLSLHSCSPIRRLHNQSNECSSSAQSISETFELYIPRLQREISTTTISENPLPSAS
jgi:hypothetical protein